jgi:hypothetical protein
MECGSLETAVNCHARIVGLGIHFSQEGMRSTHLLPTFNQLHFVAVCGKGYLKNACAAIAQHFPDAPPRQRNDKLKFVGQRRARFCRGCMPYGMEIS